jgi:hypothetical protein
MLDPAVVCFDAPISYQMEGCNWLTHSTTSEKWERVKTSSHQLEMKMKCEVMIRIETAITGNF